MNIAVINAEVVFKPIKITVASDPERRKVVYDICADYKEEESGQAGRYSISSRQSALKKAIISGRKGGRGLDCTKKLKTNWEEKKKEKNPRVWISIWAKLNLPPQRCNMYLLEIRFFKK